MPEKFTITDTTPQGKNNTGLDYGGSNWVKGTIGEYLYEAKVFPCGSQFGIREGNISKLSIRDAATRREVCSYDRDWDILPEDELVQEMVDALVEHYWA
ncbi:MAG: hypothetical protein LBI05_09185 [Planctomycetaceae bacterium]|jgi:hypothetical protein|nr:hypothetical protein [Planctomycetaceae bacterium]